MTAVTPQSPTGAVLARVGTARESFDCCDSSFRVAAWGPRADRAVERGVDRARALEQALDAFDPDSAVSTLRSTGSVTNPHVARVAERALEYHDRTDGRFDPRHGGVERAVKSYVRGDTDEVDAAFVVDGGERSVTVDGARVESSVELDLNGLAKGYLVDRVAESLRGVATRGFVDGGGDLSPPPGPVGVERPSGGAHVAVLDTDWAVASSGNYRRTRGPVDHLYDPVEGRVGARHEQVTVVARRDTLEADALATALAVTPLDEALERAEAWPGAEALLYGGGETHQTPGFDAHVRA